MASIRQGVPAKNDGRPEFESEVEVGKDHPVHFVCNNSLRSHKRNSMRVLQLLGLCALSISSLAAKSPKTSPFEKYFSSSSPIDLDTKAFDELTTGPRDYSIAVLLTAIDSKYKCKLCQDFQPEWNTIGRSWQKGDKKGEQRVLIATIDFDHDKTLFQRLQLQTAPVLLLYTPTIGANAQRNSQHRYDFSGDVKAEQIHAWISRHLPPGDHPTLSRPINYTKVIIGMTIVIGVFTFGTVAYPYVLPVIQNRNLWAGISLVAVLLFTSGHMFNHIRHVPYVSGDGRGGIQYFAGGFSNQFGMETQIVAAMYAILSFATIALALRVPRIKDAKTQQITVIIWTSVIFGMYSFLMSVFRVKNGGYPFWLPPF